MESHKENQLCRIRRKLDPRLSASVATSLSISGIFLSFIIAALKALGLNWKTCSSPKETYQISCNTALVILNIYSQITAALFCNLPEVALFEIKIFTFLLSFKVWNNCPYASLISRQKKYEMFYEILIFQNESLLSPSLLCFNIVKEQDAI